MDLRQLGWNSEFQKHFIEYGLPGCIPARVAEENKENYTVLSEEGEFLAGIKGRLRFRAEGREDFPAVGDWVLISPRPNEARATIEAILPRKTILFRKAAGKYLSQQVIASNIDTIFIVTSLNQDLNLRRLERYLSIAWESGSQPVVLLNKSDLCPDPAFFEELVRLRLSVPVHALSALNRKGMEQILDYMSEGKTSVLIGSSGVGKSTIINALMGKNAQRIQPVRESDDRGRHATTSRQMLFLPQGGIVIDTPGMREIGMWENITGVSHTFQDIEEFAANCKFRNCRHSGEPGCAVAEAVQDGVLGLERLKNYHKLDAELRFFESKTDIQVRQKNKADAKRLSKAIKKIYKERGSI